MALNLGQGKLQCEPSTDRKTFVPSRSILSSAALPGALLHQHGCLHVFRSLRKDYRSQAPGRAKPGRHTMLQGQCGEDKFCCQQLVPQLLFSTSCKQETQACSGTW